jgi:hypothetical protein
MKEKHYIRIPLPGEEDKKQSVQDNTSNLPPLQTFVTCVAVSHQRKQQYTSKSIERGYERIETQ